LKVHNFKESLSRSHSYSEEDWWEVVYRKAFHNFECMMNVRQHGWAQIGGIDRVITLRSGKTITVDEKVREKDWDDILLERWSDRERGVPGWIQKDLACDYIAYAFAPSKTCYLFPFQQLRKAWLDNGREWVNKYKTIEAVNDSGGGRTYITESIAIPKDILMPAISESMLIKW